MSPVTHFLSGWVIANAVLLNRRDRALVTLAGVVPDVDGLGILPELLTRNSAHPLLWFSLYHHSLHTLLFALFVAAGVFFMSGRSWTSSVLALLSFHVHLLEDLLGSRGSDGDQWPIPYLRPFFSGWQLAWNGQWSLNAWPNYAITIAVLLITFWLAWWRGFSPLEMISPNIDARFVAAIRDRFPKTNRA